MQTFKKYGSEMELYVDLHSVVRMRRLHAEFAFDVGFQMLREIQSAIKCPNLPGVVGCEGVVVAHEPCTCVTGMLLKYHLTRDLAILLGYVAPFPCFCLPST